MIEHRAARTVFVDRDGVINRRRDGYVKSWGEFELLPGALQGLVRIAQSDRRVFVFTNQSAIAQKLLTIETLDQIHRRLAQMVEEEGGAISAFLVCPHGRDDGCDCRKPAPGLLFRARDEFGVSLGSSIVVGDQLSDIQAARAAGTAAILVQDPADPNGNVPDIECPVVSSLAEAADLICDS